MNDWKKLSIAILYTNVSLFSLVTIRIKKRSHQGLNYKLYKHRLIIPNNKNYIQKMDFKKLKFITRDHINSKIKKYVSNCQYIALSIALNFLVSEQHIYILRGRYITILMCIGLFDCILYGYHSAIVIATKRILRLSNHVYIKYNYF